MIINRYFSYRLLRVHVEVTALLAAMLFIVRLIAELKRIHLSYNSADAIVYVLYMLPSNIARYESMIVCLATCIWFLQLRRSQEILITQIMGISMTRLCTKMLPVMILIAAVFSFNKECISPHASEYAKKQRARKVSEGNVSIQENQMWIRTKDGFLKARIGKDARKIRHVNYYIFENNELKKWQSMPEAVFKKNAWHGKNVKEFHLTPTGQVNRELSHTKLPINLKPRVISWSFLKPEYLSLWKIIVSLNKGSKFGISENMSWLLIASRTLRPLNMICMMWLICSILDKAVAIRLSGVSWRIGAALAITSIEFFVYEFMTQKQFGLDLVSSCVIAVIPISLLVLMVLSLAAFRKINSSIHASTQSA